MQLGPDGKIYISIDNNPYISVINKPNEINFTNNNNACDFEEEGVYTQIGGIGGVSGVGLPNMVDAVKPKAIIKDIFLTQYNCDSIKVSSNVCCANAYEWDFGDGSTLQYGKEVNHRFDDEGTFNVSLKVDGLLAKTIEVKVGLPQHNIVGLSSVCNNTNANLYTTHLPINGYYQYNWTSDDATITANNAYPNQAYVKWNASGTLQVAINDIKTGCKDTATFEVEKRNGIGNNSIVSNNPIQLQCKKNRPDTIKGTEPTNVSANYTYGWLFKKRGGSNFEMLSTEKGKDIVPNPMLSGEYKRFIYDEGCYHESNIINICNLKNTISPITSVCDQMSYGSEPNCYNIPDLFFWQVSSDSLNWTEIPNTRGVNNRNYVVLRTETQKWYRRVDNVYSCETDTSYSNVISFKPNNYKPYKDLEDVYICSTGGWKFVPLNFDAMDPQMQSSGRTYYRIRHGEGSAYAIGSFDSATSNWFYNDLDTVYCVQTYPGCGSFKSRKAVIYKASNTPIFATHPSDLSIGHNTVGIMSVSVSNPSGCKYQWQYSDNNSNWLDVPNGSNENIIAFINNQNCYLQVFYRAKVTNGCGVNYSNSALLTFYANTAPNQADYWMQNTNMDRGYEPDYISNGFTKSKDIWIRHNADGIKQHQDLDSDADINYVYVTVRNLGKSTTSFAKLYTYWTWGATNESWRLNWTKSNQNRTMTNGQYHPMGGEINTVGIPIPEIAPNSSIKIVIPWTDFPKKGWYDLNKQKWDKQRINVCLLARIETCDVAPYGMTNTEVSDVLFNIQYNNNIVSKNLYSLPLRQPPPNGENEGKNGEVYRSINPNIIDGGTIVVRNNDEEARKSTICIKTIDVAYFDKAETYIEIGEALKTAIEWSPSVVYSGLTHVVDNIYQVSSANACFEDVVLPAHFQDAVLPLFAYKDINDRFPDGASFSAHIQQKDSLGYLVGECVFTLTDNLFVNPEPTYIEDDTALYICNSTNLDPEILTAEYVYPASFPYVILDDNNDTVTQTFNHTYNLNQGSYTFVAIDSSSNTKYFTSVLVEVNNLNESFVTDTLPFNCELGYYGLNIYDNQTLVYDENDDLVTETSTNYYELDAVNHQYKTITTNLETCESLETTLHFDDDFFLPSEPSAFIYGDFNSETDTCAFVKTNEVTCMGQSIELNQTIDVLDINGLHLLTTTIINHETRGNGFYFCPPYWNNEPEHIYDWYSLVFRTDFCEYCRLDFRYDSTGIYERRSSLTNATLIKNRVMLYPNPANQDVNIHILGAAETGLATISIQILDQTGRILENKVHALNKDGIISLSMEQYANGVYFIKIPALKYDGKVVLIKE
jgi:hypothetical protein